MSQRSPKTSAIRVLIGVFIINLLNEIYGSALVAFSMRHPRSTIIGFALGMSLGLAIFVYQQLDFRIISNRAKSTESPENNQGDNIMPSISFSSVVSTIFILIQVAFFSTIFLIDYQMVIVLRELSTTQPCGVLAFTCLEEYITVNPENLIPWFVDELFQIYPWVLLGAFFTLINYLRSVDVAELLESEFGTPVDTSRHLIYPLTILSILSYAAVAMAVPLFLWFLAVIVFLS